LTVFEQQFSPLVGLLIFKIGLRGWLVHGLLIRQVVYVSFLVQTRADRLAVVAVQLAVHHLLLVHRAVSEEVGHLRVHVFALDEDLAVCLLIMKLISILVFLIPQKISATLSNLDLILIELLVTALTAAVHDLYLVLFHERSADLLGVGRLDELLVLLFQILLERLKCRIYNLFVLRVGDVVDLSELVQAILLVHFSFLEKMIFVEIRGWAFVLAVLVSDSRRWIQAAWCVAGELLGRNDVDSLWSYLVWEGLSLEDHVDFLLELVDVRDALQRVVVLLVRLRALRVSLHFATRHDVLGL
jgi:hypothetical protein